VHYWISGTVFASVLLSGCSSWTSAEPSATAEIKPIQPLVVPAGLKAPKAPSQFDVPAKVASGVKGEEVELKAPMQVLAVSTNAMVEEEDKEVRVFFERNEYTGDLLPFIQQQIKNFVIKDQIEVQSSAALNWQTGWVNSYRETGWWWWKGTELSQQSRFQIELQPKTHGRTVGVQVRLLEHKFADSDKPISPIGQRREEVHFLNRVIDHVANVELALIREAKAKRPDVLLTRAVNDKNEAVLLTTQSIDVAWSQLEIIFEKLSLEVTDLNRTDYVFYLNFKKPESGFWGSIWGGDEQPVLPLADGDYQLLLSKSDKGTILKWRDKDGAALDKATVDAIYDVLVTTIRQEKIEL
jgi:uncharacterized lipoprotein